MLPVAIMNQKKKESNSDLCTPHLYANAPARRPRRGSASLRLRLLHHNRTHTHEISNRPHDAGAYAMQQRCPPRKQPEGGLAFLELPVLVNGLDGPIKLFAQRLGEEALNGDIEFLGEDDGETGVDVVLEKKPLA